MINRTEFTKRFAMLLDRFGRTMSEPGILEYYEILNAELNTTEFQHAAKTIYRHDQFWPTPQRFIDAARGSQDEHAQAAWDAMLDAARQGKYPPLEELPTAIRAALKAVPLREIMYADDIKLARLKKEFTAAHNKAKREPDQPLALPAPELEFLT